MGRESWTVRLAQWNLKGSYKREAGGSGSERGWKMLASCVDGGRGREPGYEGSLYWPEKAKKQTPPWSLWKARSPATILILGRLTSTTARKYVCVGLSHRVGFPRPP